jgi:hypothetical protein
MLNNIYSNEYGGKNTNTNLEYFAVMHRRIVDYDYRLFCYRFRKFVENTDYLFRI